MKKKYCLTSACCKNKGFNSSVMQNGVLATGVSCSCQAVALLFKDSSIVCYDRSVVMEGNACLG